MDYAFKANTEIRELNIRHVSGVLNFKMFDDVVKSSALSVSCIISIETEEKTKKLNLKNLC